MLGESSGICDSRARAGIAVLLAVVLGFSVAACGSSSDPPPNLTLIIGARTPTEPSIIGEVYAQALERVGYKVERDFALGFETAWARESLKRGDLAGYPEHVGTALESFFGVELEDIPTDPQSAYEMAKADFEKEGLTAFPPTPVSLFNAVGILRRTADERGLKTLSDLRGQSREMTLDGPFKCRPRLDCLAGLDRYYGLKFKRFDAVEENLMYKVLESGEADASFLPSTEGHLVTERGRFTILEDDKHAFPPGNTIFVARKSVVEKAGPDFEKAIVESQQGLTLPVVQRLDAEVEIERIAPEKVAEKYLNSIDFTG